MEKGTAHAAVHNLELPAIVEQRLHPDMLPFQFQVISIYHHSLGAINGVRDGLFQPPPSMPGIDYAGLRELVDEAITGLEALEVEEVEAFGGKSMLFRAGDFEVPFKVENFLLSFSLPNFYFHATTAYAILRALGVPLGKLDFLGQMRSGN